MIDVSEMDPKDLQASLTGIVMAFQDAIRALSMTHPAPGTLAQAMYKEREETIAILLAKGSSDLTIDAYRDIIDSMRPHIEGDDMSPP